jgi:tRNA threonylcarbamoyladenosine biosynthesis protein TsaE
LLPDAALSLFLADEADTALFGARLASVIEPRLKIYLSGDLGSGKTTLVRGALRALGYQGTVKSPTYTLVETYRVSSLYLYHFDFYRLKHQDEWDEAGLRELFDDCGACLVEWPEQARDRLPEPDLVVTLNLEGKGRRIEVAAKTDKGRQCVARLAAQ